jgi:hypothetical protein
VIFVFVFDAVRAGDAPVVVREFPPTFTTTPSGLFTYTFLVW